MNQHLLIFIVLHIGLISFAQYQSVEHREIPGNENAVKTAEVLDKPGATYVLANDISSENSTLFLGKSITLDLNGYSITFADADYKHIQNSGFEEGLIGWDVSKAPGAKVVNTKDVHVFLGEQLMRLKAMDEITSSDASFSNSIFGFEIDTPSVEVLIFTFMPFASLPPRLSKRIPS